MNFGVLLSLLPLLLTVCHGGSFDQPTYARDGHVYTTVKVGTPGRYYNLTLNSASSTLWLFSPTCKSRSNKNPFDPRASSTFKNISRAFKTAEVQGSVGKDVLTLGGTSLSSVDLGVAEAEVREVREIIDGVLGLGKPLKLPDNVDMAPFFDKVGGKKFAVWQRRGGDGREDYGAIRFGKSNGGRTCHDQVDFYPFEGIWFWFNSSGLSFDKYSFTKTYKTLVQPFNDYWLLPKEINDALRVAFKANQFGLVNCNGKFPDVTLNFGKNKYTVPGKDLVLKRGDFCVLATTGMDLSLFNIAIGRQFLYTHCVVFDYENNRFGISKVR